MVLMGILMGSGVRVVERAQGRILDWVEKNSGPALKTLLHYGST
jgi:hypothetical protein